VLPIPAASIRVTTTVCATEQLLRLADEHIKAGPLPVLKDTSKQELLEKARQWETSQYGRPLWPEPAREAGGQKSLFD
jgi:hypothetical protein